MAQYIKNWKELAQVPPNDKYKIVVDENDCCGWIRPIQETEETKRDYFKHHIYLSTHTFYSSQYEDSTKLLKLFGFDVELANWG